MSTFRVITADPPWRFGDSLSKMKAATPRSAAANYGTMSVEELKALPVQLVAEDDAVLGLWVPCSMLAEGLAVMSAWGFRQVQEWTWVKLTTFHDEEISVTSAGNIGVGTRAALRALGRSARKGDRVQFGEYYEHGEIVFDLPLAFGMGRLARSCKETFLVGVRGSPYKHLKNKSIRDVFFAEAGPHSQKPECVQDALDEMFPEGNRLELFARRQRGHTAHEYLWTCVGNEAPDTMGEDIRDSLKRLLGKP
jgi:N6-adenosine-specific RNA methylase IME4